ncbi:MAG: hypothetical protein WCH46_01960 [bacterium]
MENTQTILTPELGKKNKKILAILLATILSLVVISVVYIIIYPNL